MIERRPCPRRRRMTRLARRREHRRNVIRVRRSLVLGLVTAVAIRRSSRILAADVTTRAGDARMRARQWEPRAVVIESGRLPGRRAVTYRAVEGEPGSLVVRIGRAVIRSEVTSRASRTQVVVSVHVTGRARDTRMRACQRESRFTVIERGARPRRSRMTHRAIRRESGSYVVRVSRLVEIRDMT